MKSPQRWPLIKGGKWDGERLWWNLNRLEMSMDRMSWKMYSLSEIRPSPSPLFFTFPTCFPARCLHASSSANYNIHQRPLPFPRVDVHPAWPNCFQTERKHPIWVQMESKWMWDRHANDLCRWFWLHLPKSGNAVFLWSVKHTPWKWK